MRRRIETIDMALRSHRQRRAVDNLWVLQVLRAVADGTARQGEKASLGDEEAIGRDAERGVVVKATPAATPS